MNNDDTNEETAKPASARSPSRELIAAGAVGSAALVAALLYAGRRRGRGRSVGAPPTAPQTGEATD